MADVARAQSPDTADHVAPTTTATAMPASCIRSRATAAGRAISSGGRPGTILRGNVLLTDSRLGSAGGGPPPGGVGCRVVMTVESTTPTITSRAGAVPTACCGRHRVFLVPGMTHVKAVAVDGVGPTSVGHLDPLSAANFELAWRSATAGDRGPGTAVCLRHAARNELTQPCRVVPDLAVRVGASICL